MPKFRNLRPCQQKQELLTDLADDEFCVKCTACLDTFEYVDHVTRRNAKGIEPCDNLAEGSPAAYLGQSNAWLVSNARTCPGNDDGLAWRKRIGLDNEWPFFDP